MQKVSDAIAAEDADDEAKIATDLVPVSVSLCDIQQNLISF